MVEVHERYIRSLEQAGALNRELEFLPTDDGFAERRAAGGGLTAARVRDPALAHEDRARRRSCSPPTCRTIPYLSSELERYFPTRLRERFGDAAPAPPAAARDHRDAGRQRPRQPRRHDVRVPAAATRPAPAPTTSPAPTPPPARSSSCAASGRRSRRSTGRARGDADRDAAQGAHPARARDALAAAQPAPAARHRRDGRALRAGRGDARRGAAGAARPVRARGRAREGAALAGVGVPAELAERVAHLEALVPTLRHRRDRGRDRAGRRRRPPDVYFALGARLELHWLRDRIVALPRETRWEAMARAALRDDVYSEQAALTAEVLRVRSPASSAGWPRTRARSSGRCRCSRTSGPAARSISPGCRSPCARSAT